MDKVDQLRTIAEFRGYPYLDRAPLWHERMLVNAAELKAFQSLPQLAEPPILQLATPTPESSKSERTSQDVDLPGDLAQASARAIAAAVRAGKLSPVDVAEFFIARVEKHRDLNTFISFDPAQIRLDAKVLATRRAKGEDIGPLAGVPISIKDIMAVRGHPLTGGTKSMPGDVSERDAACVSNVRAAGAIVFGTAHLPELSYEATGNNPHFGRVKNPVYPSRIIWASSGGSAAGVAAGLVPLSIATDPGGSARVSATSCGVVAFKPTHNRISRDGVIPVAWSLDDVAAMGRNVEDVALLFEVLADFPAGSTLGAEAKPARSIRLLRPETHFFENVDPVLTAAIDTCARTLQQTGVTIVSKPVENMKFALAAHFITLFAEAAENHWSKLIDHPDKLGSDTRARLEVGQFISAVDYVKAQRLRRVIRDALVSAMDGMDAMIAPVVGSALPEAVSVSATIQGSAPAAREGGRYTSPFNTTGLPAIAIPCGVDARGLPVGLQIAGRPGEDALVLEVARTCADIIATAKQ